MEQLATILTYAVVGMATLIMILLIIWLVITLREQQKSSEKNNAEIKKENPQEKSTKNGYEKQSILNFMEFDTIDDNMIIQKNGTRFLMVIECQGVNYDLMSSVEKTGVEKGFVQFLNALRNPIQIYIQTRSVNLEGSISGYKEKLRKVEDKLNRMKMQYYDMLDSGTYTQEQIEKAFYELTKQTNLYEYGRDIIKDTERLSLNRNVLNKKYYIVVPYYASELESTDLDKDEIKSLAFSEAYTRAQSLIASIAGCGVRGKILRTNELIELLYIAYNRDEAETFGLDKALQAGYNEINSTAPDVLDKRMRELDKYIEQKAKEKARNIVNQVMSEKELNVETKEDNMEDLITQMVEAILKENEKSIGTKVMNKSLEKLEEETKTKEKKIKRGGIKDGKIV